MEELFHGCSGEMFSPSLADFVASIYHQITLSYFCSAQLMERVKGTGEGKELRGLSIAKEETAYWKPFIFLTDNIVLI